MNGVTVPVAARDRKAGVLRVAEVAGVAHANGRSRSPRHSTVVMVGNSEWLLAKFTPVSRTFAKVGARSGRHGGGAQPVGDEQDDVLLRPARAADAARAGEQHAGAQAVSS